MDAYTKIELQIAGYIQSDLENPNSEENLKSVKKQLIEAINRGTFAIATNPIEFNFNPKIDPRNIESLPVLKFGMIC